jgi:hypothetical protein
MNGWMRTKTKELSDIVGKIFYKEMKREENMKLEASKNTEKKRRK